MDGPIEEVPRVFVSRRRGAGTRFSPLLSTTRTLARSKAAQRRGRHDASRRVEAKSTAVEARACLSDCASLSSHHQSAVKSGSPLTDTPVPLQCGQIFSRAEYARRHWRAKRELHCSRFLPSRMSSDLAAILYSTDEPGAAALRCAACDTAFSRPDILARHIRMYHKEGAESETAAAEFSLLAAAAADIAVPAPIPLVPTSPNARKQGPATEEEAAPDPTAATVIVSTAEEAPDEDFDREWQLPLPPPVEPVTTGIPELATGETLEAFLQAEDSTSSLSIGGEAQVTASLSPERDAATEIFLPWDFPALDKTPNPGPAKRARAAAVPVDSAQNRTSPSSESGQSSDCSHSSPLDLLAAAGVASASMSGEPAAPPLPPLADPELDLLQELHTLPPAIPPIRADEIMHNRSLRPRYFAMQLYDDEATEDWVEAEFEDDGVASWLQGATVKPIRSKEPDMYPGLDQYVSLTWPFFRAGLNFCTRTACSASSGILARGSGWRISASASRTSIVGRAARVHTV